MPSILRHKHRLAGGGGAGSPGAVDPSGSIALNFDTGGLPELWASNGTAWQRINPPAAITTQSINLGAAGADIGAAYTLWAATPGNTLTGNVVIATWGTPAQAYVLTNSANPGAAVSWTSLGGAVAFATAAEIAAGTDTTKAINSAILRGETLNAPSTGAAAAADANKLIRLNAQGQIDADFLPAMPTNVRGGLDVTQAFAQAVPPYAAGDLVFANADGTVGTGWTGAVGDPVHSGDVLLFDGTDWYVLPNTTNLAGYLELAGGTMSDGAGITFDTSTATAGAGAQTQTIINGAGGMIDDCFLDNCEIDGGTF